MFILGIFGIGKIYRLRRRYDRLRERTDRIGDKGKKVRLLKFLDEIEPTLVMLEEKDISRYEKRRMVHNIKSSLEQAKFMLQQHEDLQRQQYQQPQMQRR